MGIDLRLFLSWDGVYALRELGDRIPCTTNNIVSSTEKVVQVYQSVSENVGPHAGEFAEMVHSIKKYMEVSDESLKVVKTGIYFTAQKIEDYLNSTEGGQQPPKRVLKPKR